jgi:hypothetical protein
MSVFYNAADHFPQEICKRPYGKYYAGRMERTPSFALPQASARARIQQFPKNPLFQPASASDLRR